MTQAKGWPYNATFTYALTVDRVGRAIHKAKTVGGPWGPPCGYPRARGRTEALPGHFNAQDYDDAEWVTVQYDDNSMDEFACDCGSMAIHLLEILGND